MFLVLISLISFSSNIVIQEHECSVKSAVYFMGGRPKAINVRKKTHKNEPNSVNWYSEKLYNLDLLLVQCILKVFDFAAVFNH